MKLSFLFSIANPFSSSCRTAINTCSITTHFILLETDHAGNVGAAARAMKTMGFENNDSMILVNPFDKKVLNRRRAKQMASGAIQILQSATICSTLEEALQKVIVSFRENDDDESEKKNNVRDEYNENNDNENSNKNEKEIKMIVCGTGMPHDMYRERQSRTYCAPRVYFQELLFDHHHHPEEEINDHNQNQNKQQQLHMVFLFGNERYGMRDHDLDQCDVVLGIPTNPRFGSLNLASAVQLIAYDWREAIRWDNYPLGDNKTDTEL